MSGTHYLILSAHKHCPHFSHGSKNMIFLLICQNLQFSIWFYISCVFSFNCTLVILCMHVSCTTMTVLETILVLLLLLHLIWFDLKTVAVQFTGLEPRRPHLWTILQKQVHGTQLRDHDELKWRLRAELVAVDHSVVVSAIRRACFVDSRLVSGLLHGCLVEICSYLMRMSYRFISCWTSKSWSHRTALIFV